MAAPKLSGWVRLLILGLSGDIAKPKAKGDGPIGTLCYFHALCRRLGQGSASKQCLFDERTAAMTQARLRKPPIPATPPEPYSESPVR